MIDADVVVGDRREFESDDFMDAIDPVLPYGFRLAYGMLRNRDDAADVVQEATLNAWRHWRSFRTGADVRPWFLAIVANQCRQTVRQHWWSVVRKSDLVAQSSETGEAPSEEVDNLRRGLRKLSHADRLVLVLRYYLDLSFSDVAAMLHTSPAAARVRTHRALARLRPIIGSAEDLDDA
ncbi:MAG: sigma-70 family RNA polymerase sigma factor [Chloroflexi bacterium]|nr:MAG: sigma-70 family RNA polymerase sigma factor [Chloroflexota bacterium]